jgi:hypothetical protein
MTLLKNLARINVEGFALYAVLAAVLYLISSELHMWVVYLIVPLVMLIELSGYNRGINDGVNVIMSSMTILEQTALAEKLTAIEEELNDQK